MFVHSEIPTRGPLPFRALHVIARATKDPEHQAKLVAHVQHAIRTAFRDAEDRALRARATGRAAGGWYIAEGDVRCAADDQAMDESPERCTFPLPRAEDVGWEQPYPLI